MGVAVVAALRLTVGIGDQLIDGAEGVDGLFVFLWLLMIVPVVGLAVGVTAGMVLRLPLGWLVGLLSPIPALAAFAAVSGTPILREGLAAAYAGVAAALAALRGAVSVEDDLPGPSPEPSPAPRRRAW